MIELMKALFIGDDETIIPPEVSGHRINIEVFLMTLRCLTHFQQV